MPPDTQNKESQLPTSPEERKKLFAALVAEMGHDAAREELDRVTASMTKKTGEQARTVVAATGVETQPSRLLSFAESEAFLKENGVDLKLGEAREDEVRSMIRWGALDKKSADQYGASFDGVQTPENDLRKLVEQLKTERTLKQSLDYGGNYLKVRVVLGVDNMTPDQGFQKLIVEAGLLCVIDKRFSEYQRVDTKTRRPLQDQAPTGKAGILFTPDYLNLPAYFGELSPDDQLANARIANARMAIEKMEKYIGPVSWMKLFRQSVNRALPVLFSKEAANEQYAAFVKRASRNEKLCDIENEEMVSGANGMGKYVGPVGWMKLFRQSVDRALPVLFPEEAANIDSLSPEQYTALVQKALSDQRIGEYLPDVTAGTHFPDLRSRVGRDCMEVPSLFFKKNADGRYVCYLYNDYTNISTYFAGGRPALGTFLS